MATDAVPTPSEKAPERRRRRRPFLLLFVLAGLLALIATSAVMGYYMTTRRPLTQLPVVERVARVVPPRFLFQFAGVARPVGIAVSPDGQHIYVAEGGGERLIRTFDREGRPAGKMAPPDTKPGLRKPGHLAVDAAGRLYALDRLRSSVDLYAPSSQQYEGIWNAAAIEAMGGWLPNGLSIAPDGRVYVPDIGQEHSVLVFGADGRLVNRLSKSMGLADGLNYPVHAVADDEGRVYISDAVAGRVLAVGSRGAIAVGLMGEEAVALPLGLAVGDGKLFVADGAGHRIVVFAVGDRPQFLHAFGDSDDDLGLAYPMAVALDRTGRIYVADRVNDRVQVWTY